VIFKKLILSLALLMCFSSFNAAHALDVDLIPDRHQLTLKAIKELREMTERLKDVHPVPNKEPGTSPTNPEDQTNEMLR